MWNIPRSKFPSPLLSSKPPLTDYLSTLLLSLFPNPYPTKIKRNPSFKSFLTSSIPTIPVAVLLARNRIQRFLKPSSDENVHLSHRENFSKERIRRCTQEDFVLISILPSWCRSLIIYLLLSIRAETRPNRYEINEILDLRNQTRFP